ncbi:DUF1549 and DUF1553 domain-containing protein [Aquisphaera insulae]|uniref:DUF1549 and DUF1553 domain-containing protein n=1 Tax=Aquisphaera insulae TaxID=2712864 RepID=UPI00202E7D7A|nr:DUF1549 and DUF1553 domain-containing protein [Aquisphaera insulae]
MERTPGLIARAVACLMLATPAAGAAEPGPWALKPVVRPGTPAGASTTPINPIDAFLAADHRAKGLTPAGPADKRTLLRRVTFDLTGLPPTIAEQEAFLRDSSPDAYEKVVDRLLASEQHGVRYGRFWLDVLRYADVDERMVAAAGIHLWRDWVIRAINDDLPYDQFVRAQLTGYRSAERTQISATGHRSRKEPRADDMFALGLLSRGAVFRDGKDAGELPMAAVETVSSAFMGMTVACAKCHDHMFDPISQRDYYAMKALFDPLVVRKVVLATPAEIVAAGKAIDEAERKRAAVEGPIDELIAPYRKRLHDERVAMLPPEVRAIILKPDAERSAAERKVADDYFPVLRIDTDKILAVMPEAEKRRYRELQAKLDAAGGGRRDAPLAAFWTVEVDPRRAAETSYILTSGDPDRPEKKHPVEPGWPFGPEKPDFREGRIEAFSDWLTTAENPLFARVAVNRLWQWHFGEGLHRSPSDFGKLGGTPADPALLDWLASEFAARGFRMKAIHRLIVTSEAYRRGSEAPPGLAESNAASDPTNAYLWRFPLRRLEAEPIWDAIWAAAGGLDMAVGGPSFDPAGGRGGMRGGSTGTGTGTATASPTSRRAAYMIRGYSTSRDVVPVFLQAFDVDDGRVPCPVRTRTVAPPQALFLMNGEAVERATVRFAARLKDESGGDLAAAVDLAYRLAISRPPTPAEKDRSLAYIDRDPERLKGLAWLLLNLDEFLFVR